ncbi:transcriptional regulator TbsP domain-containing protein [Haloarcula sp. CGMCC 1.2071]|uniref:transcriptional regulator TbsP domain-containing protein n=1 Tax=Haloarcula sp. CGMCC 1.2071 TaxID=3111454 RepID=UPI00300EB939
MNSLWEFDSDEVKLVISDIELMWNVVDYLWADNAVHFDIVIPEREARNVRLGFPLNARISELITQDKVNIYASEATPLSTIVFDGSQLYTLVRFGQIEQFAKSTNEGLQTSLNAEFVRITESAELVDPDILAWSELLGQLEQIVDSDTRHEFERLIEAARIDNLGALDHISVALVAAAHSGALLNDLSTWSEEVGLASAATFSRRKQKLEDSGIIYTEKVPIEVGRPKQRLKLSDAISKVEIQGEELDITREGGQNVPNTVGDTDAGSDSATEQLDTTDIAHGDEDLQLLEQELKEAIQSQ